MAKITIQEGRTRSLLPKLNISNMLVYKQVTIAFKTYSNCHPKAKVKFQLNDPLIIDDINNFMKGVVT